MTDTPTPSAAPDPSTTNISTGHIDTASREGAGQSARLRRDSRGRHPIVRAEQIKLLANGLNLLAAVVIVGGFVFPLMLGSANLTLGVTLLVIGASVLLFAGGWFLLGFLPDTADGEGQG